MADCTGLDEGVNEEQPTGKERSEGVWLIMVDASRNEQGSGAKVVIRSPEGAEVSYAVKFEFQLMNNQAQYVKYKCATQEGG